MRGFVVAFGLVGAPLIALAPATARAADPAAQVAARARGEEGLRLFREGKWDAAYAAFSEADTLYHAPTLVLYMANCRKSQGRLVEARALYLKVTAEPVPAWAPEAFKKAQATAQHEADALGRLAVVTVAVTGGGAAQPRFTVDGAPAGAADLASGMALAPGAHVIAAEGRAWPGGPASRSARARRPASRSRSRPARRPADRSSPPPSRSASAGWGSSRAPWRAGSRSARSTRRTPGCTDHAGTWVCPAAQEKASTSATSAAHTLTAVEAAGFAVGGAGVIAGVVLAILRPGGGKGVERAGLGFDVRFDVDLRREGAWAGVEGRF